MVNVNVKRLRIIMEVARCRTIFFCFVSILLWNTSARAKSVSLRTFNIANFTVHSKVVVYTFCFQHQHNSHVFFGQNQRQRLWRNQQRRHQL